MPVIIMTNLFFEMEKVKEFKDVSTRNSRKIIKTLDQVGRSNKAYDETRKAQLPGKRISKSGKVYWETRKNRSDATDSST